MFRVPRELGKVEVSQDPYIAFPHTYLLYCRTNNFFDSVHLKGGTVVVYSLFVVGSIGFGVLC